MALSRFRFGNGIKDPVRGNIQPLPRFEEGVDQFPLLELCGSGKIETGDWTMCLVNLLNKISSEPVPGTELIDIF